MDRNTLGLMAGILVVAALFTFIGYKAGENHAPSIRLEFGTCF